MSTIEKPRLKIGYIPIIEAVLEARAAYCKPGKP